MGGAVLGVVAGSAGDVSPPEPHHSSDKTVQTVCGRPESSRKNAAASTRSAGFSSSSSPRKTTVSAAISRAPKRRRPALVTAACAFRTARFAACSTGWERSVRSSSMSGTTTSKSAIRCRSNSWRRGEPEARITRAGTCKALTRRERRGSRGPPRGSTPGSPKARPPEPLCRIRLGRGSTEIPGRRGASRAPRKEFLRECRGEEVEGIPNGFELSISPPVIVARDKPPFKSGLHDGNAYLDGRYAPRYRVAAWSWTRSSAG